MEVIIFLQEVGCRRPILINYFRKTFLNYLMKWYEKIVIRIFYMIEKIWRSFTSGSEKLKIIIQFSDSIYVHNLSCRSFNSIEFLAMIWRMLYQDNEARIRGISTTDENYWYWQSSLYNFFYNTDDDVFDLEDIRWSDPGSCIYAAWTIISNVVLFNRLTETFCNYSSISRFELQLNFASDLFSFHMSISSSGFFVPRL